ncbi:group III truncated hemoglobin [Pseudofulvibacter geojedonensis]|uniref:Group III truncated hemoglobin n=1 Tax=Pseudofulvibacter geojedonensis TaxID=1123758 RepID=A0ABW3I331_9FLAO
MQILTDIKNREDVFLLVSAFYEKVKVDRELGPFFNNVISDWESHIIHLTNFWESQLFMKNVFSGNPLKKHVEVDKKNNNSIQNEHFGIWLNYWLQTIDELFLGERAQLAKNRARNMGIFMFMEIFKARQ